MTYFFIVTLYLTSGTHVTRWHLWDTALSRKFLLKHYVVVMATAIHNVQPASRLLSGSQSFVLVPVRPVFNEVNPPSIWIWLCEDNVRELVCGRLAVIPRVTVLICLSTHRFFTCRQERKSVSNTRLRRNRPRDGLVPPPSKPVWVSAQRQGATRK